MDAASATVTPPPEPERKMSRPVKHVEYVLTASFDIDAGPTMTFQYPAPIQGDRYLMAELMLPDGSHSRTQDWTMFFLYSEPGSSTLEYNISDEKEKQAATKYYVLNLCQTEFTDAVKRGASVKAMCLITPHPYFHVFKPLLILALDAYLRSPNVKHLQTLYDAINSIDVSRMPRLSPSEKLVLASSENTTLFSDKFEQAAISPRGDHQQTGSLFDPNSGNDGEPSYYIDLKNQGLVSRIARDTHFYETKVDFNGKKIPIKIPMDFFAESVGDFSLIRLISTVTSITGRFDMLHPQLTIYGPGTPPLIVLINALLTQKRILFVGMNSPSSDVAEHVLAACSLASGGILRSFNTHAFPYTDLSKVDDLLSSDGYIAGVKNPAFERHADWWDVIVDTEQGVMKISPEIGSTLAATTDRSFASPNPDDMQFVETLKTMIANHYGETSIRTHCRQYIKRFVRIAINYEEHRYGATNLWPSPTDPNYKVVPGYGYTWPSEHHKLQDFATYSPVIEGWRTSRSYHYYVEDQQRSWEKPPKFVVDFEYHLDRLRLQKLTYEESGFIFNTLCSHTKDYDDINRLLSASSLGNLFYLAMGLFHRDSSVRTLTVLLIQRIEHHAAGKVFFKGMSPFQKLAYRRLQAEAAHQKPLPPSNGPSTPPSKDALAT
ncbi:hypothetical protein TRVA0_040S00606 [Trichomonascus vanleenenianus]|uniref:Afi1p n=1 Tax=Trichomonascus vanleenenianus TaxID=2268995 RepID=UPI003ECA8D80